EKNETVEQPSAVTHPTVEETTFAPTAATEDAKRSDEILEGSDQRSEQQQEDSD
ncbi:unnamed protein product, partial [Durusdinium trenchii]